MPWSFFLALLGIAALYVLTAEATKRAFYKWWRGPPGGRDVAREARQP